MVKTTIIFREMITRGFRRFIGERGETFFPETQGILIEYIQKNLALVVLYVNINARSVSRNGEWFIYFNPIFKVKVLGEDIEHYFDDLVDAIICFKKNVVEFK